MLPPSVYPHSSVVISRRIRHAPLLSGKVKHPVERCLVHMLRHSRYILRMIKRHGLVSLLAFDIVTRAADDFRCSTVGRRELAGQFPAHGTIGVKKGSHESQQETTGDEQETKPA